MLAAGGWRLAAVREMAQDLITLACTDCQRENYHTSKNKKNVTGRLERRKHCPWCRKHTIHKETK